MGKTLTKEEFVEKARKVHGDKYDYSKVEYVNSKTKVCIICPKHGEFWQTPNHHINDKSGCLVCGQLQSISNRTFYTNEKVNEIASKCRSVKELKNNYPSVYAAAQRLGITKKIHQYFNKDESKYPYCWNLERAIEAAKLCQTRSEFLKRFNRAWRILRKNDLLDKYFPNLRNPAERVHIVYKYFFKTTNSIYIGRTLQILIKRRHYDHKTSLNDTVYKHARETKQSIPQLQVICSNLTCDESKQKEYEFIEEYRKKGYNILNKAKTGLYSSSIGALNHGKLSYEYCYKCAKECKTIKEFDDFFSSACQKARKRNWMKDYTWFKPLHKPKGYWDIYEHFWEEFERCGKSLSKLKKDNNNCYNHAIKHGWTKGLGKNHKIEWTEELLRLETIKYPTRILLLNNNRSAYRKLQKLGLLDKFYNNVK